MKQIAFLLFFLLSLVNSFAQNNEKPFQSGEYLKFRVRYGFLNTSEATLLLKDTIILGKTFFHAIGKGKTTGLARLFFKVDDLYESIFEKESTQPLIFIRNIYEGGYTKNIKVHFDSISNTARITNLKEHRQTSVSVPKMIQDAISAFYFLREQTDISQIRIGDEISIKTLFDDDEIFTFKLRLLRKEPINTNFGTINTLVFRPLVQDGRVFRQKESVTLWISNDNNKIPVQIRAELRVGSLTAELVDFHKIKYPFTVKK